MSTPTETFPTLSDQPEPNLVLTGGGGGTSVMAAAVADYWPGANLTAIVSTSDSGGSTGLLREQFGTPPVGDIRKVTSALATERDLAASFEHRFGDAEGLETVQRHGRFLLSRLVDRSDMELADLCGAAQTIEHALELAGKLDSVKGHAFGNLIMTSLALKDKSGIVGAAATVGRWLQTRGRVLPVTTTRHDLVMLDGDDIIVGEHEIDERQVQHPRDATISLEPHTSGQRIGVSPEAREALANADMTVVGPGSVFTSILPVISVEGVTDAMAESQAQGGTLLAIGNLITGRDTTRMPFVAEIVRKVEGALGDNRIAHVLYNTDMQVLPAETALPYTSSEFDVPNWDAYGHPLVKRERVHIDPHDAVSATRSTAHHDAEAVVGAMQTIWALHAAGSDKQALVGAR